eukprot:TRINITY_DN12948_c0_g2_i1.p1 TRINITY_DN12948_c0_g2~~TRINITY_DN12948_c0_g2_i1.p1  ORF type:complete len:184 (-),score=37.22 TRINITY_DN12948_c0_g2_i1:173-724(-)
MVLPAFLFKPLLLLLLVATAGMGILYPEALRLALEVVQFLGRGLIWVFGEWTTLAVLLSALYVLESEWRRRRGAAVARPMAAAVVAGQDRRAIVLRMLRMVTGLRMRQVLAGLWRWRLNSQDGRTMHRLVRRSSGVARMVHCLVLWVGQQGSVKALVTSWRLSSFTQVCERSPEATTLRQTDL